MTLSLSQRAELVVQSEIRAMTIECQRAGGINLAQGVCDTEVPLVVRRAAQRAMDEGVNSYTRYDGLPPLRRAIAAYLRRAYGMSVDPEQEVVASAGATGAFHSTCLALLDPGDEVLLFEPAYSYHVSTLLSIGARPRYVRLRPPGWSLDAAGLERLRSPRLKAIVLNSPANPSGKVFAPEELAAVATFAQSQDCFVITDEIYEHFLYDGRRHLPIATLPGMAERTITISGFSKTFSVTGWRLGYAVAQPRWARLIGYLSDLVYVCAPAPLQLGAAAGLEELGPEFYEGLRREYSAKRDRLCAALAAAGLAPHVPQGAYYVLADASRLPGENDKERAMGLLARAGVAAVPGSAFYPGGIGGDEGCGTLLRFCFAKRDDELDEACRRLERWRGR